MKLRKEDDDITHDINIFRTDSLSQETIRYPCFKPEIVSQAHKIHTLGTNKFSKNLKSSSKNY